jgi:glutamyl-tRNA synthetase
MRITHVIRGSEYLSSTPKYNIIYNTFGWDIPKYIHLPPVMKDAEHKLSKRHGDASFEDFYNKGYLKDAIINYIALLGWSPGTEEEFFNLDELIEKFSINGLSKSPSIFDVNKLKWMNGEYIRKMTLEEFHEHAIPYYKEVILNNSINLEKISKILHTRVEVFSEIPDMIDFIESLPDYNKELYIHAKMKTTLENSLENLLKAYDVLKEIGDWKEEIIHEKLFSLILKLGVKNGQVLWPIRTALSGKEFTPGGAIEIAGILGREESLRRVELGIQKLKS